MNLTDIYLRSSYITRFLPADSYLRSSYYVATLVAFALLVVGPLVFYVWASVWSEPPGLGGHFTLEGYRSLFQSSVYLTLKNTLVVAILGSVVSMVIGVCGLILSLKTTIRGRRIIAFVIIIQYLLPAWILAIGWEFYAGPNGLINQALMLLPFIDSPVVNIYSVWGIALVGGANWAGLVYLLTSGAIISIPYSLEEAAKVSGASNVGILRRVILPLAIPSLAISGVLVFTRMSATFGLPLILGIPGRIFVASTHMYSAVNLYPPNFAFASALGMVVLVVSVLGLIVQRRITGSRSKYETVIGKGDTTRSLKFDLGGYGNHVTYLTFVALLLLYVLPYLAIFLFSIQKGFAGMNIAEAQWTLENYESIFFGVNAGAFRDAYMNTIIVAGVGAFLGMVLSAMASYIIVKSESKTGDLLDFVSLAPAAVPSIIIATAFLWFFLTYNVLGIYGTVWILILAIAAKTIVYGTRATNSSFNAIGSELEEMAQMSGANFVTIFRRIFLPLIKSGFSAGFIILFIDFAKVLTIPLFLSSGSNRVLSTFIWEAGQQRNDQVGAAISVVLIVTLALLYIIMDRYTNVDVMRL